MISSKHILKDPEAFKLSLSHFMAVTTPSFPTIVMAMGKRAPRSGVAPFTSSKSPVVSWNMEGR